MGRRRCARGSGQDGGAREIGGEGTRRPPAATAEASVKGRRRCAQRQGWGHEGEEEKNQTGWGRSGRKGRPRSSAPSRCRPRARVFPGRTTSSRVEGDLGREDGEAERRCSLRSSATSRCRRPRASSRAAAPPGVSRGRGGRGELPPKVGFGRESGSLRRRRMRDWGRTGGLR
jgi:hypothetical protein